MKFENLIEKISNPLRKQSLDGQPTNSQKASESAKQWKDYILSGEITNPSDLRIKNTYLTYRKSFPRRAEVWLDQQANEYVKNYFRAKSEGRRKIYSKFGVDVYLDDHADPEFDKNPKNIKLVDQAVTEMIMYINEILPNKKPNVYITNATTNPVFKTINRNTAALYYDRRIYMDQNKIIPSIMIHEYAHYVADIVPKQTEPILRKAYNEMLDTYWKRAKVKRQELDPTDPRQEKNAQIWRSRIAKKLGFPDEYGLRNQDEFFAILIEHWKQMPANSATYKFKSIVKNVLTRL